MFHLSHKISPRNLYNYGHSQAVDVGHVPCHLKNPLKHLNCQELRPTFLPVFGKCIEVITIITTVALRYTYSLYTSKQAMADVMECIPEFMVMKCSFLHNSVEHGL